MLCISWQEAAGGGRRSALVVDAANRIEEGLASASTQCSCFDRRPQSMRYHFKERDGCLVLGSEGRRDKNSERNMGMSPLRIAAGMVFVLSLSTLNTAQGITCTPGDTV